MTITQIHSGEKWDAFLSRGQVRPFLQSYAMGDVYSEIGQLPVRLMAEEDGKVLGISFGHIVDARRGKHLSIPYGPILSDELNETDQNAVLQELIAGMKECAREKQCLFLRVSPFLPIGPCAHSFQKLKGSVQSPLHLLAEHVWYLPLTLKDFWCEPTAEPTEQRSEEDILMGMRKTTRNLIRRAEKDGVVIEASSDPVRDVEHFIALHAETRRRHGFTPYSDTFFRAQVQHFAKRHECTVYLARFQDTVIASSIHIHAFGETSYHHGASSSEYSKVPASYLLQWTAIRDALKRGDHIYNFWGIAPEGSKKSHPFAGVTLFKTGFGGKALHLEHCRDFPLSKKYWLTYGFETLRKWRRGF